MLTSDQIRKVGLESVLVLRGKTPAGMAYVAEHGERWFVREVDGSVLGGNLGFLVCPERYLAMGFLSPPTPDPRGIGWVISNSWGQTEGECAWVHPTRDPNLEVVSVDG